MKTNKHLRFLVRLALLVALQFAMRLLGLGKVPVGPLNMSFLTLPIAVGAIVLGPAAGVILGGVFGALSFYDAISGAGGMTAVLMGISPVHTFVLCVGMRMLMGLCCGLVFRLCRSVDSKYDGNPKLGWSYFVGAVSAPLLNTLFFMGYICLVFYRTEYIQGLVTKLGAANPIMFVVLLVGVQGLMEAAVCGILGGIVAKAVDTVIKRSE